MTAGTVESSSVTTTTNDVQVGPDLNATRAPLDRKLYRHITLSNGLQAVLIQDTVAMQQQQQPQPPLAEDEDSSLDEQVEDLQDDDDDSTDDESSQSNNDSNSSRDAACCILVGAGSASDPHSCPGLAHFLEHLLFLGSTTYPAENDYDSYVSKHGGSDNAWTEWETTCYTLTVPVTALWGAMDRLAQFFIDPLLGPSSVDREVQAIESEFRLSQRNDGTRRAQLLCSCANPDHPLHKFSWGNQFSLGTVPERQGVDRRKALWEFYNRHYYAQNMKLVVQGACTLDDLQAGVVKYCSNIPALPRDGSPPNQQQTVMEAAGFPLPARTLGTVTRLVPVKDRHAVVVAWQIPSQLPHWRSKPTDVLAHLLGHEASGSLLSYLRQRSWATSCMAGCGEEGSENATSHALFSVSFVLSETGLEHWKEVVEAVYQYIGLLRHQSRQGWPSYVYQELYQMMQRSYLFGDETSPEQTCENIVEDMAPHKCIPTENLLNGSALIFEFDEVAIQDLLDNYLVPKKARIDLTSSTFGNPVDFEDPPVDETSTATTVEHLVIKDESNDGTFDKSMAENPQVDPMFTTQFWCRKLPKAWLEVLATAAEPQLPALEALRLPPPNPYVPSNFDLKPWPDDDADHPLLYASLKLCLPVGKTQQWFTATVVRYDRNKNAALLSFEDEDKQWYVLDQSIHEVTTELLSSWNSFEGTMHKSTVKYRIVALSAAAGGTKGAGIRRFGDESDMNVDDGTSFPPIPPPSTRFPLQIADMSALKMWWLQDRNFKRPIAEFRLQLVCARANATPLHRAVADLLSILCSDALLETAYLAEMCELGSSISTSDTGIDLRLNGFDNKLLDLLETIGKLLFGFRGKIKLPDEIDDDRFAACLEVLRRRYKNSGMSSSSLASSIRLAAMRPNKRSSHELLTAIENITIDSFCGTVSDLLKDIAAEVFFHGNVDRKNADRARDLVLSMLETSGGAGLPRKKYPSLSVLKIPSVKKATLLVVPSKDTEEPNTSCEVYFQIGKDDLKTRCLNDLLMHMMEEPLYDQLRTKEQFGYDVHCDVRWSYGIIGCIFHVTTSVKSAADIVTRVDQFLTEYRKELLEMTLDVYNEHLVGLAKGKLEMFNSLSEETSCLWGEIRDGRFQWEAWRDETVCLRSLTKEDALKAFDDWLCPGGRRKVLAVQVIGTGDTEASLGRPVVTADELPGFADSAVESFHEICKNQTWGRVNSKLF